MTGERGSLLRNMALALGLAACVLPVPFVIHGNIWKIPDRGTLEYMEGSVTHCMVKGGRKAHWHALFRIGDEGWTLFVSPGDVGSFKEICRRFHEGPKPVVRVGYDPASPPLAWAFDGIGSFRKVYAWDVSISGETVVDHAKLGQWVWRDSLLSLVELFFWQGLFAAIFVSAWRRARQVSQVPAEAKPR